MRLQITIEKAIEYSIAFSVVDKRSGQNQFLIAYFAEVVILAAPFFHFCRRHKNLALPNALSKKIPPAKMSDKLHSFLPAVILLSLINF